MSPPRRLTARKLLVASLGVAAISYAGCREPPMTTGNLVPPPPPDAGPSTGNEAVNPMTVDGGSPTPPVDGGAPSPIDAGTPPLPVDSGTPPPPPDAGARPLDAGRVVVPKWPTTGNLVPPPPPDGGKRGGGAPGL